MRTGAVSRIASALLALALLALLPETAPARSKYSFPYPLEEVYSAAVRLVRIDRGCTITDRDPQAAYILFECREDKKLHRGALELFSSDTGVRAQLSLLDEPSYMEVRWLEQLARKLREERGPPKPAPAPPADGGAQGGGR
ncbi:MAG: hypothetical protein RMK29_14580 [Myxococcales bacterium]|nr:hypothetical protein [Myxococcota bacterium]MDW8282938.1 hypothetical protein [Myxococcales bacterium]